MSLAMFAASIDDNSNITMPNNSDNILNQKRHKRTQRKYPKIENYDNKKVNSILEKLHNMDEDDDDKDNFNPPPNPESMGAQKTIPTKETFGGMNNSLAKSVGKAPMPNYEGGDNLDLNDYTNYGNSKEIEDYYKNVLPGYKNSVNKPYYPYREPQSNYINNDSSHDVLIQKLNYMISLLEDQKDEKTNNVTEEVILYSFLGIFIIFIADTFVKAGKYTR
jgi:hypothetical protein